MSYTISGDIKITKPDGSEVQFKIPKAKGVLIHKQTWLELRNAIMLEEGGILDANGDDSPADFSNTGFEGNMDATGAPHGFRIDESTGELIPLEPQNCGM